MSQVLTKAQKSLIASLFTRHGRKKSPFCVAEGLRAVRELAASAPERIEYIAAKSPGMAEFDGSYLLLPENEFEKLSGTVTSQGILAVASVPEFIPADAPVSGDFILALDRIADPGNFGTICRTAKAAGVRELWLTEGTTDPFGDKAIRSGMSSQFTMRLRKFASLEELKAAAERLGYDNMYLSLPQGGKNCFTEPGLFSKSVLVIGNEANGVEKIAGTHHINIPMPGNFESLNAAQAATILIFEYVRRLTSV